MAGRKRFHSYPFSRGEKDAEVSKATEEADFTTASDVFPFRVPLERVQLGSLKYIAKEMEDLELLYELESSDLLVRASIRGRSKQAVPALFRIHGVSAATLKLVNIVPGSPETMVAQLLLETESQIRYVEDSLAVGLKVKSSTDHEEKVLDCRMVTLNASVHECGYLRDILLFLKCDCVDQLNLGPQSLFLSPQRQASISEEDPPPMDEKNKVIFVESMPNWTAYIPWWIYSKTTRVLIQRIILLYTIFSFMWASWQLYRHVNVIQVALEPIITILREYLSGVMEMFDSVFAMFTLWWQTILSPLNIFSGILLTPLLQIAGQMKFLFSPILVAVTQCWNSALLGVLKPIFVSLFGFLRHSGHILLRPLYYIWQTILNSRVAVASLDLKHIRLSWALNLITGSFRAIQSGLVKLVGYTRTKHKQKKALQHPRSNTASPVVSPHRQQQRRVPVYYKSPLTKQD